MSEEMYTLDSPIAAEKFAKSVINKAQDGSEDYLTSEEINFLKAMVLYISCNEKLANKEYDVMEEIEEFVAERSITEINNLACLLPPSHPARVSFKEFSYCEESVKKMIINGTLNKLYKFEDCISPYEREWNILNRFIRKITSTPVAKLKASFKGDIKQEEDSEILCGNMRLFHVLFAGKAVPIIALFYGNEPNSTTKGMRIIDMQSYKVLLTATNQQFFSKDEIINETKDDTEGEKVGYTNSWTINQNPYNARISEITEIVEKIRKILIRGEKINDEHKINTQSKQF